MQNDGRPHSKVCASFLLLDNTVHQLLLTRLHYTFMNSSIDKNSVEGFGSVMKKCMNMLSSNKIIGIQEAQCGIMQMLLTLSSELLYYLTTSTKMRLSVDHQGSTLYDLKTCYIKRSMESKSMCLAEFFYQVHKKG